MTILKDIKPELQPNANNKLPARWRRRAVPVLTPVLYTDVAAARPQSPEHSSQQLTRTSTRERPISQQGSQHLSQQASQHASQHASQQAGQSARSRSEHLDIRPPSAYSVSIKLPVAIEKSWTTGSALNTARVSLLPQ